jgi:hypothetical protein
MSNPQNIYSKQGKFWLAGSPQAKAAVGILSVTSDGDVNLSLAPGLNSLSIDHLPNNSFTYEPQRVVGTLEDGRDVLLPEARIGSSSLTANRLVPDNFQAQSCIITSNYRFKENTEPKIESLSFPLGPLRAWFRPDLPLVERKEDKFTVIFPKERSEVYNTKIGSIKIENSIGYGSDLKKREFKTHDQYLLKITPKNPFSIEEAIETTKSIEDFLILFTDQVVSLPWPKAKLLQLPEDADFYFRRMNAPKEQFSFFNCWLDYSNIQRKFEDLIDAWFSLKESFGPAFYLYAGDRRAQSLYTEHRFISLITGLEAFHIKTARTISKPKVEQKIERILTKTSPHLQSSDWKWIKNLSAKCLKPILSERLQDLINSLPIQFDKSEVEKFSESCAGLRNDLSHYGGPRTKMVNYKTFVMDVHLRYRALRIIYHALLLDKIGIQPDLVKSAVQKSYISGRIRYELKEAGLNLPVPPVPSPLKPPV